MEAEYIKLKVGDVCQDGDEFITSPLDSWRKVTSGIGGLYNYCDMEGAIWRRPIALATGTKPVVESILDTTISSNEFDEQDKPQEWGGESPLKTGDKCLIKRTDGGNFGHGVIVFIDKYCCVWRWLGERITFCSDLHELTFEPSPTEAEKEREEFASSLSQSFCDAGSILSDFDGVHQFGLVLYDWLKSTDRLKGGDDHE